MSELFEFKQENEFIELIYPLDNGMNAEELGNAILGMQSCLNEVAKIVELKDFEIIIFPIEKGSVKTVFKYVKKNSLKIFIGVDIAFNLLNNGFSLIDNFGLSKTHSLDKEVIQQSSIKALELCKNQNFIEGSQKIVAPLKESIQQVEIKYGEKETVIKYENKSKFFEEIKKEEDEEIILPELKNDETITIAGEIVRINKQSEDLGFRYKDKNLKCQLLNDEKKKTSITQFHKFIEENQVLLTGIVERKNNFETPEIKIIKIEEIQQELSLKD